MPEQGLIQIVPSSVVKVGGSSTASIGTYGRVTFTDCASLSFENVFSSSYKNYMFVLTFTAAANRDVFLRFRTGGVDTATGYADSSCVVNGTSVANTLSTAQTDIYIASTNALYRVATTAFIFHPFDTTRTLVRASHANDSGGALLYELAGVQGDATSFESFTLFTTSTVFTGDISIYAFNQ